MRHMEESSDSYHIGVGQLFWNFPVEVWVNCSGISQLRCGSTVLEFPMELRCGSTVLEFPMELRCGSTVLEFPS